MEQLEERIVPSLLAAFDFGEASGTTVLDSSGGGNNGTITGATRTVAGKYGAALSFNGAGDLVTVPDAASLRLTTGMTLEAWVNPSATSTDWSTAILKERPGGLAYALYATDGAGKPPAGYINRGSDVKAAGSSALPLNTWSHLAATYDGATIRLYVNGTQVGSKAQTGSITTSTSALRIGGNSVWGEYFKGLIDEVRVYNTALTATQIQADMSTPISGTPDTIVPTVSLTGPADGATVSGTVTVSASASDNVGVAGVQFLLNGANLGSEDTSAPYSLSWNTAGVANGSYTLSARARDAAGNNATATSITVTVNNVPDTTAPSVSLTVPADGSTVSGTITVSASASDNVGVAGVQFKLDGNNLGAEDTTAPYSVSWDTTTATPGTHTLTAVARDTSNNVTTSTTVTVTVDNSDRTPPTVSITGPSNNATVSGSIAVSASASDNVGVAGVQFLLDSNNLGGEDASAPYSVSWNTTTASNGTHTLTARARDAAGNTTTSITITVTVSNSSGVPLTINGAQTFQTIDGFGVNINPHSWNAGEVIPALDLLNDQMGATVYRVAYDMEDWESVNDNADPNTPDWTYYNALYSNASFQELWGTLHYLNQKGVSNGIVLSFMGRVPAWMGASYIDLSLEAEWVEMMTTLVAYARNTEHVQFAMLDPLNEPDWNGIEGPQVAAPQYTRLLDKLATKLDALGLGDIRLVGPNTANISAGVNTYMPAMMNDPVVMNKVDHFGLHDYSGSTGGADSAIKQSAYPTKNFWITEVTNPPDILSQIGGNASAIMVWDGYDSAYIHPTLHGASMTPPNDAGNGPAPLAYDIATGTYTPRQSFYQDEQIFKYVPPGSVRVGATQSNGNLTVYAFYQASSGRVTIVGRNAGSSNISMAGSLSNLPTVTGFEFYKTDAGSNFLRLADVSVNGGSFSFVAPASSYFTLTALALPDTTPPSVSVTGPADGSVVGGTVTVSAAASDNMGVAGVQFLLNGSSLGAEDTASPYSVSWDTRTVANGVYTLTARARDAAGNTTVATSVAITVNNDLSAPAVTLTAPADGATLSGTVTVSADASDNIGVVGVQFLLDGASLAAEDLTAPYAISWDTASVPGGTHTLAARARDAAGNTTTSNVVTVTTLNTDSTPPTVSLTSPANGATVSGVVTLTASASDDVGVAGVQFLLNGSALGSEDTSSPYSVSWNTAGVSNGSYTLSARARDAAGNNATATSVTVTVSNAAPTGLVGAWGFEEGTGTSTADVSGHSLNGTLSNATWASTGKYGKALSFNGTNAWVTVADNTLLHLTNGMTVEAWVNPSATSTDWTAAVLKERPGGLSYALYATDGANKPPAGYINRGSDVEAAGTSVLPLNTWSHLAVTYDGATIRLYVNGTQVGSKAQTGNITSSTSALRFGGDSVWGEYFKGLIDEVRVYSRALTVAQIQTDMTTPVGGGAGALALDAGPAPAAAPVRRALVGVPALSADALAPFSAEAVARWRAAGVPEASLASLAGWSFQVADLPGGQLGFTSAGTIWIDRDAAGRGWFIDATPGDDVEFPAMPHSPAYGRVDLLTVVVHEVGHALGFEHESGDGIMAEALPLGVRRMPTPDAGDPAVAIGIVSDTHPAAVGATPPAPLTTVAIVSSAPNSADQPGQVNSAEESLPTAMLDRVFAGSDSLFAAVPDDALVKGIA